jgi:putative serine protease PepD
VAPPDVTEPLPVTPLEPEGGKPRSTWGWRALMAFLAGGLVAAGGFGAAVAGGWLAASDDGDVAAGVVQPTGTTPAPDPVPRPDPPDTDEPAAYVAQLLGPSVVQLESGSGVGSGVVIDEGLILTNFHVVEGSTDVKATLATGLVVGGEVIGTDANTDVAVVRLDEPVSVPVAELAVGEPVEVGQFAVAIGSPFDLQQTVTAGIVSAIDRPVPNSEVSVVAMIQTDAPINPGNSGGALADRFGRVIGINTAIQTGGFSNTNAGVGFAIPIDTAMRVANLLIAGEPIQPGFLGVTGEQPPPGELGIVLTEITEGSAAEFAGLQAGDRVISLNGAPVSEMVELAGLVQSNQAGDTVNVEIRRDGSPLTVEVTLGSRPSDD